MNEANIENLLEETNFGLKVIAVLMMLLLVTVFMGLPV